MYVDPDPECDEEGWGTARANAVPAVAVVAFGGAFAAQYGADRLFEYVAMLGEYATMPGEYGVVLQFALIAGLVVCHEAIHALSYATIGGVPRDDVAVDVAAFPDGRYGPLHVSVHPERPVRRSAYAVGVAMPGIVLGLLPATVALLTGNPLVLFVGVVGLVLVATDVGTLVDLWRRPESLAPTDPAV